MVLLLAPKSRPAIGGRLYYIQRSEGRIPKLRFRCLPDRRQKLQPRFRPQAEAFLRRLRLVHAACDLGYDFVGHVVHLRTGLRVPILGRFPRLAFLLLAFAISAPTFQQVGGTREERGLRPSLPVRRGSWYGQ